MLGSGQLGQQTLLPAGTLPAANIVANVTAPIPQPSTTKASSASRILQGSFTVTIVCVSFFALFVL
jgi:hypothetical protein